MYKTLMYDIDNIVITTIIFVGVAAAVFPNDFEIESYKMQNLLWSVVRKFPTLLELHIP